MAALSILFQCTTGHGENEARCGEVSPICEASRGCVGELAGFGEFIFRQLDCQQNRRSLRMTASVDWVETFKRTFLRDDLDGFMELIAPDCDWTIMATGEKFTGAPRIRELAQRS